METQQINIKWECVDLPVCPVETFVGIQRGEEVIAVQPLKEGSLHFEFEVTIKPERADFAGPFVHGKRGERFVYLVWIAQNALGCERFGRSKIGLNTTLPWDLVEKCLAGNKILRAKIRLTNEKGKPALASLKPEMVNWEPDAG